MGVEAVIVVAGVVLTLILIYLGIQQEKIRQTMDTTHDLVNNDHTVLTARLVEALDRLGEPVTDAEREVAEQPIVPPNGRTMRREKGK